jgi:hypothetical protein
MNWRIIKIKYFYLFTNYIVPQGGGWKFDKLEVCDLWELYDMTSDRTETKDLSRQYEQLREDMISEWSRMAVRMKVIPKGENGTPNPVVSGSLKVGTTNDCKRTK